MLYSITAIHQNIYILTVSLIWSHEMLVDIENAKNGDEHDGTYLNAFFSQISSYTNKLNFLPPSPIKSSNCLTDDAVK